MSLLKILNNNGPKGEPWGILFVMVPTSDRTLPNLIPKVVFVRKLLKHLRYVVELT